MKEMKDLNINEYRQMYDNAWTFLHNYSDHVHSLFDKETPAVPPSGSDIFRPALWKGMHWVWFFEHSNDIHFSLKDTK